MGFFFQSYNIDKLIVEEKLFYKSVHYRDRDIMYKLKVASAHGLKFFDFSAISIKIFLSSIANNVLPMVSLFILLFDRFPSFIQINHTKDNKLTKQIKGVKINCKKKQSWVFLKFLCLHKEFYLNLKNFFNSKNLIFNFSPFIFGDIAKYYEHFAMLPELSVSFNNFVTHFGSINRTFFFSLIF